MSFYRSLLLEVCVFAVLLSACGGGGSDGGSSPVVVLNNDTASIQVGDTILVDVLSNDTGVATIDGVSVDLGGVALIENGKVRFTANHDFVGTAIVTYEAGGLRADLTITVMPEPLSSQPVDDVYRVNQTDVDAADPQTFPVFANDIFASNDSLRLTSVTKPLLGSIESFAAEGEVIYKPAPGVYGRDRFDYEVVTSEGDAHSATVTVMLAVGESDPVPANDAAVVVSGQSITIDLLANDVITGESLVELVTQPRVLGLELSGGAATVTAPNNFLGSDQFEYRLVPSDETLDSVDLTAAVSVTVYSELPSAQTENLEAPQLLTPRLGIRPKELAVIVNSDDPASWALARDYLSRRQIPEENLFELSLGASASVSADDFTRATSLFWSLLPNDIQAFALMFTEPYRVECQSITTAFGFGGFDDQYCNTSGSTCGNTAASDYFNSSSTRPHEDDSVRPAMMVTGLSTEDAASLIGRGIAADQQFYTGEAYFYRTADTARSVRWATFQNTAAEWNQSGALSCQYVDASSAGTSQTLIGADNVLFYLTGLTRVSDLDTLSFKSGAVADHLTSFGGQLSSTAGQMSALEWLDAGATGSYGTVVEPCNYSAKFPRSDVLLNHYYRGGSLVEAYWKSVERPGEGVFVGEPLARPWGRKSLVYDNDSLILKTTELVPGQTYQVSSSSRFNGDYEVIKEVTVDAHGLTEIRIDDVDKPYYRLQ